MAIEVKELKDWDNGIMREGWKNGMMALEWGADLLRSRGEEREA